MKYMYYTVIVFNKGTYVSELLSKKLWSHSRVPTGSHHNSIIFSENRYFFYIFGMYMYIFIPMAIYHQECMYIFVIMLKVIWNVHLINCISQKMFHSFSMFFLTSIHVHHYICNSCWNLQIEIKSPKSDFFLQICCQTDSLPVLHVLYFLFIILLSY